METQSSQYLCIIVGKQNLIECFIKILKEAKVYVFVIKKYCANIWDCLGKSTYQDKDISELIYACYVLNTELGKLYFTFCLYQALYIYT